MTFRKVHVVSSNIEAVSYRPEIRQLEIEFKSGSVYIYDNVDVRIYDELTSASSVGSYFHQNVRSQYPYQRIL